MRQRFSCGAAVCCLLFASCVGPNSVLEGQLVERIGYAADHNQRLADVEVDGWRVEAMMAGGGSVGYVAAPRCGGASFPRVEIPRDKMLLVLQRQCGEARAVLISEHVLSTRHLDSDPDVSEVCLERAVIYRHGVQEPQHEINVIDLVLCQP